MKDNAYFNEMKRVMDAWNERVTELYAQHRATFNEFGWHSSEADAVRREMEATQSPYESGEIKAFNAWLRSVSSEASEFEVDAIVWQNEMSDFASTLRKAGIKTFVVTDENIDLVQIKNFAKAGCRMTELCTIIKTLHQYGITENVEVDGIRFVLD